eukprot:2169810-Pyramimonas_sp.AAC.1
MLSSLVGRARWRCGDAELVVLNVLSDVELVVLDELGDVELVGLDVVPRVSQAVAIDIMIASRRRTRRR